MAYQKLPDVQHAIRWVEVVLGETGVCSGDIESLRNGVLFCRVVAKLLDHCVDLSQVRTHGNPEMTTIHNLTLLNKSLQRYGIKMPSKLQVPLNLRAPCPAPASRLSADIIFSLFRLPSRTSGKSAAARGTLSTCSCQTPERLELHFSCRT
jgi:hypothetical protein